MRLFREDRIQIGNALTELILVSLAVSFIPQVAQDTVEMKDLPFLSFLLLGLWDHGQSWHAEDT